MTNTDPKYLRDIILNFLIAGKDTTAATLSWFIYALCKHPHIQEKVSQEIKETMGKEEDTDMPGFTDRLSEAALEKMHYLHAALTETLRLYPAVPVVRIYSKMSIVRIHLTIFLLLFLHSSYFLLFIPLCPFAFSDNTLNLPVHFL